MAILGGVAVAGFALFYGLDLYATGGSPDESATGLGRFVRFDPGLIADSLSGLAGMTAAVLGIVITVVGAVTG